MRVFLDGTRSAARSGAAKYTKVLEDIGFVQGAASPCNFYNTEKDARASIHGDDTKPVGEEEDVIAVERDLGDSGPEGPKSLAPLPAPGCPPRGRSPRSGRRADLLAF